MRHSTLWLGSELGLSWLTCCSRPAGLGIYSKQGDSVRLGKKVYLECCDQDIIEEKWIYEG
jgi:hypothetical protein